jgi:CheY-like chemotaxis protein
MLSKDSKILVVDDMKMIRKSLIQYLYALGYEDVIEASNGADAVAKIRVGTIKFVFLDIVMPHLTGDEALKKIRELNPDIPIAMMTSVDDDDTINSCKKLGIVGYILKPLDADTGPKRLSDVLAKVA